MLNERFILVNLLVLIWTTFTLLITSTSLSFAEEKIFEADGECLMGNTGVENVDISQNKARENAYRKVNEQAGFFIESISEMKNNTLTQNQIKIISRNFLRVEYSEVTQEIVPNIDAIKFKCHVKAWINSDDVIKNFPNTSLEKIEYQVKMEKDQDVYREKNETEIENLRQQYKNADNDIKRQEIATAIKRNETKFSATQLYQKGVDSYNKGNLVEATKFYNQSIEMDNLYAAPLTGLGWIYNDQGQYAKAIEYFQKSISLYGDIAVPYNGLAYAYNYTNDYNKAVEYGNKAIQLDSKYAAAWNNIGLAYNNLGNYSKAIEYYNKAMAIAPNDEVPFINIGNAYYRQKNFAKAMEYYQKSININSNHANVWYNLGNIYGQNGEIDKAIESYKKVTALDSQNVRAWIMTGYLNNQKKNFEEAKKSFKKALKLNPNSAAAWAGLGFACDGLGDYSGAYEAYKKAMELEPNNENYKTSMDILKQKIG